MAHRRSTRWAYFLRGTFAAAKESGAFLMVSIGDALKWHLETIREHIHQIEASLAEFELIRL
jgi:hypothetical protein